MQVEVTLNLPEQLVEGAKRFGAFTHQQAESVLADTLEMMSPLIEDSPDFFPHTPIPSLSDEEVLQLADSKMDELQNRRLGELQTKGKSFGLSPAEHYELLALLRIYQFGQLRKSEAMAEAVERDLRKPLTA